MPRTFFQSGRTFLLFLLAFTAAIIGGAWWWQRPPPEPVFQGRWLSELVAAEQATHWELSPDQAKGYGPAGVAWLIYKVEHGRQPVTKEGPLPLETAPAWLRRISPEKWGGLRVSTAVDERFAAVNMLQWFGPDAAPAIPALVRNLESPEFLMPGAAAFTLHCIGPASWPTVQNILDTGSKQARMRLISSMWARLVPHDDEVNDPTLVPAVDALVKALHDPDPEVRTTTATAVSDCNTSRKNDALCEPAIPALVELLSDIEHPNVQVTAIATLATFEVKATSATPRLIELLDHNDRWVRVNAGGALFSIDKVEKRSEARFRAMLNDPGYRYLAVRALKAFGVASAEENASEEELPIH